MQSTTAKQTIEEFRSIFARFDYRTKLSLTTDHILCQRNSENSLSQLEFST